MDFLQELGSHRGGLVSLLWHRLVLRVRGFGFRRRPPPCRRGSSLGLGRPRRRGTPMTFPEALQSHKGGLLLLKTQLYWYDGRGWDGVHDRVCLLLNAADDLDGAAARATAALPPRLTAHAALLLVDGAPHWVWVSQADVELL